ncbi:hypothetical protein CC86DRAFT_388789 [Ophiobolus disseminans]|uniref:Uncharacterized protein n=1 Tax=Ophiobolus disseminans TaxID=1469910 RepID=A0A6A6ZD81_9PLEO|nr:hypothetical protein CC86DRAFT_388789 [Ophiobolus disseminans]
MNVLNFKSSTTATSSYRPILIKILFILCIPIFFYHLVPGFSAASGAFISDLTSRIRAHTSSEGYCTTEIGDAQCCTLYLDAAPCVDECRKQHVDRVTFTLTKEYEVCADTCLGTYAAACQKVESGS